MKMTFRRFRDEQGFTLVELVVVVAVLGVLAWLITPRVFDSINNSKLKSSDSAANEIMSAMARYASNESGAYPAEDDLDDVAELSGTLDLTVSNLGSFLDLDSFAYAPGTEEYCITFDSQGKDEDGDAVIYWITQDSVTTGATEPLAICP